MQVEDVMNKNKELIPTDSCVDLFINEFLHNVINTFKQAIVEIKRNNQITFKISEAANHAKQSIFNEDEIKTISSNLKMLKQDWEQQQNPDAKDESEDVQIEFEGVDKV